MSEEQLPSAPSRRYAVIGVKIAVSAALLALLFSRIDLDRLWAGARNASLSWLAVALLLYLANVLAGIWRWWLLLDAQSVQVAPRTLLGSMLVALFFNNFLPSNIGGDVVRIRDTARSAGSTTLATMVVLVDRVIGLMGLVLVAALGATAASALTRRGSAPIWPMWLWAGFIISTMVSAPAVLAPAGVGRLLQPLTVFQPEWVEDHIDDV